MKSGVSTLIAVLGMSISVCQAQRATHDLSQGPLFISGQPGKVTITEDEKLTQLVNRHVSLSAQLPGMPGYRVQVFFNSDRNASFQAQSIKKALMTAYPEHDVYVAYQNPFFSVRVGDFRSRKEAKRFQILIKEAYPNSWVVEDYIDYPSCREDEDTDE